jgi:hypothetical protein
MELDEDGVIYGQFGMEINALDGGTTVKNWF